MLALAAAELLICTRFLSSKECLQLSARTPTICSIPVPDTDTPRDMYQQTLCRPESGKIHRSDIIRRVVVLLGSSESGFGFQLSLLPPIHRRTLNLYIVS